VERFYTFFGNSCLDKNIKLSLVEKKIVTKFEDNRSMFRECTSRLKIGIIALNYDQSPDLLLLIYCSY